jgi:hypothetical protein
VKLYLNGDLSSLKQPEQNREAKSITAHNEKHSNNKLLAILRRPDTNLGKCITGKYIFCKF